MSVLTTKNATPEQPRWPRLTSWQLPPRKPIQCRQLTLIFCFLVLATSAPQRAADLEEITGGVADPQGSPVAGAKLTLTDSPGSFVRETLANEQGSSGSRALSTDATRWWLRPTASSR